MKYHPLTKIIIKNGVKFDRRGRNMIFGGDVDKIIRKWLKEKADKLRHDISTGHSCFVYDTLEIIEEQTLEEKFIERNRQFNDGSRVSVDPFSQYAQIAKEHYEDKK